MGEELRAVGMVCRPLLHAGGFMRRAWASPCWGSAVLASHVAVGPLRRGCGSRNAVWFLSVGGHRRREQPRWARRPVPAIGVSRRSRGPKAVSELSARLGKDDDDSDAGS